MTTQYKEIRGFTLIEIITVLAILSILASVLIPITIKNIDESRLTAAHKDSNAIATAIVNFHIDTKLWPVYTTHPGSKNIYILETAEGDDATATGNGVWLSANSDYFSDQLINNETNPQYINWRGPYLGEFKPDPWGRKYYASIGSLWDNGGWAAGADPAQAWVISSGPDGNIDTDPKGTLNNDPTGDVDDIGFLISSYGG